MAAKSKKGIIGLVICAVLLVAILIVSIAVGTNFENIAQANATPVASVSKTQASLNGMQGGRNIEREGAVLLKNENDTLPLGDKGVTLLGTRSHHYVLGGTGSAGGRDDASTVMMNTAFSNAGISYNENAWTWLNNAMGGGHATAVNNQYVASADSNRFSSSNWTSYQTILEFSRETYEQFVTDSVIGNYDTAVVTLGRTGAEGASPSLDYDGNGDTTTGRHYLELSDDEKDLLAFCAENFESTVVLLNSAVPIEMGFIDNPAYNIDAAMWIGHPGEAGMNGVADLLKGNINPSGHLVDTYAYDLSTNPTFWSANDQAYTNVESTSSGGGQGWGPGGGNSIGSGNKYYQYNEGIYVGYRYYETADAAGYFDSPEFEAIKWKGNLVSAYFNVRTAELIGRVFLILSIVLSLFLLFGISGRESLAREKEEIEQMLRREETLHRISKENIDLINVKCHDLKHRLRAGRGALTDEEIKEIEGAVALYDGFVKTGNPDLDIVIAEKSLRCRKSGITISCIADGSALGFMLPGDIYALFGNALDNAIEYLENADKDKRIIDLTVRRRDDIVGITVENYCAQPSVFSDGLPVTSKKDRNYHGFGMKSMRYIAEKYGGSLIVSQENEKFVLAIVLSMRSVKSA